jgi:nucleotide-binding universal stress UspA family protein
MKLIENILLAEDFSSSSENVVTTAIEIAKIFDSEIIPMHVLPDDIMNEKANALLNETAMKRLEAIVERAKQEGVKAKEIILSFGSPHQAIVQTAMDVNAKLIVIGSGETQKGDKFLLGSTAKRIIQKSEKPVFVVKEGVALNVRHILCPVDFSATSKRALKNAITMCRRFKAELTILSVCEMPSYSWFASGKDLEEEKDDRYAQHKKTFDEFMQDFNLSDLKWSKETFKGNPAEQILHAVAAKMVDLLVIGTTGKTGLNRLVIGSVAEKVIREVPCSFLTLKSEDIITLQVETNIRDIENHYNTALQLMEDGFFKEAIDQFKLCLRINDMHVPAYYGIAKVYGKLNEPKKEELFRNQGKEILDRIWYTKIEEEARKFRGL